MGKRRIARIVASAEKLFGEPVRQVSTPGGERRSSCRLHFRDRTVVATLRPNFRRTHLEAYTLRQLGRYCDDLPECLGVDGEILFQSDVGRRRLNVEIAKCEDAAREDLAAEAVASIFRIHAAGRQAGLRAVLPHLGQNRAWIETLVGGVDALARFSSGRAARLDKAALCEAVAAPAQQFVKWDCRSGNAALGRDDRLRWFDFEYSGVRHGAEDVAWLIGDEAWPLAPQRMEDIVADALGSGSRQDRDAWLDYLALYVSFHAAQRLILIVREAEKRGWQSKRRIRKYDDVGVHPGLAAHICRVGAYFAARNAATAPLARDFEETGEVFAGILREGLSRARREAVPAC